MTNNIKTTIENQVLGLNNFLNSGKINDLVNELNTQQIVALRTRLGVAAGQVFAGFEGLSNNADDIVSSLTESIPTQITALEPVIARMTAQVPGVKAQLVQAVPSASDLEKITGTTAAVASDLLDTVVALGTPEAIAAAVKGVVPTVSTSTLNNIAENIIDINQPLIENLSDIDDLSIQDPTAIRNALQKSIAQVTKTRGGLESIKSTLTSSINKDLNKLLSEVDTGFGSLIENTIESVLSPAQNIIGKIAIKNGIIQSVNTNDVKRIIGFVKIDDYNNALKIMKKYSDLPDATIIDSLKQIDNRLSAVAARNTEGVSVSARDITSYQNGWKGVSTSPNLFSNINFKEELLADLQNVTRDITEIVVHHTFTGLNQNLNAGDLQQIYSTTYQIGLPYHYIILRPGDIQRGRPIDIETEPFVNNHHKNSIHIAFVGGLNIPTRSYGQVDTERHTSSKSFTPQQWKSYDTFLQTAFKVYPAIQVLGHNSIDIQARDPNFDPSEYAEAKYGKKLLFTDPGSQQPFTRQQLIERNIQQ